VRGGSSASPPGNTARREDTLGEESCGIRHYTSGSNDTSISDMEQFRAGLRQPGLDRRSSSTAPDQSAQISTSSPAPSVQTGATRPGSELGNRFPGGMGVSPMRSDSQADIGQCRRLIRSRCTGGTPVPRGDPLAFTQQRAFRAAARRKPARVRGLRSGRAGAAAWVPLPACGAWAYWGASAERDSTRISPPLRR